MKVNLFLKGVLLYVTLLCCIIAVMGIDSISENGYFTEAILIIAGLIILCKKLISEEEMKSLLIK